MSTVRSGVKRARPSQPFVANPMRVEQLNGCFETRDMIRFRLRLRQLVIDNAIRYVFCAPTSPCYGKPFDPRVHFDRYAPATQRLQGMIVADGRVKLGFVPGTCDSTVQTLLAQCVGDAALFQRTGFVGLAHDRALKRTLDAHWRAPPARSLVLWKQGVVHYEALAAPSLFPSLCWRFSADDLALGEQRLRFVVGTHVVDNAVLPLRASTRQTAAT